MSKHGSDYNEQPTPFDVLVEEMKREALKNFGSKFSVTGSATVGDSILHDLHRLFIAEIVTQTAHAVREATLKVVADAIEENTAFYEQKYGGNYEQCGRDIKFSIAQALEAHLATLSTKKHEN